MATIITVRVAAIGMRDSAFFSGEHRLPACPFRQLAEKLFEHSLPKIFATLSRRRQAADDCRLAACAPQNNSPHFYGDRQKMIDHIRSAIWIAFHGLGSTE